MPSHPACCWSGGPYRRTPITEPSARGAATGNYGLRPFGRNGLHELAARLPLVVFRAFDVQGVFERSDSSGRDGVHVALSEVDDQGSAASRIGCCLGWLCSGCRRSHFMVRKRNASSRLVYSAACDRNGHARSDDQDVPMSARTESGSWSNLQGRPLRTPEVGVEAGSTITVGAWVAGPGAPAGTR